MSFKEQNESIKQTIKRAFSLTEDSASHSEIRTRLLDGGKVTGTNMAVLVCAMVIASVGLNMSSTAVIIGAMLISPLMGSILASAFASVSADYPLLKKHMAGFGLQILISVVAAISIPSIFAKIQERQTVARVKYMYATLNNAFQMAVLKNGPIANWELSSDDERNREVITKNILPINNE